MKKTELIATISKRSRESEKSVENVLETLADVAWLVLQDGGKAALPGIGKISIKGKTPKYSACKALKKTFKNG